MKMWQRMSNREKFLALGTLLVLVLAAVYNFALQDAVANWRGLRGEVAAKERLLARNLDLIAQEQQIKANYIQAARYIKSGSDDSRLASQTLKTIQAMAGRDIVLENVKPLQTRTTRLGRLYEFELEGHAPKETLTKFLDKIANSKDAIRVRNITLSATRSGQELRYYMIVSKLHVL